MSECKYSVTVTDIYPIEAIELKDKLVRSGLVLNRDFEWIYRAAQYSDWSARDEVPRHAVYSFRDPHLATFYQLKWC